MRLRWCGILAATTAAVAWGAPLTARAAPAQPAAGSVNVVGDSTLTFAAAADGWIDKGHPRRNHGADTRLVARTGPTADALVRFDVAGVGAGTSCPDVTGASMSLTVGSSPRDGSVRGGSFYGTTSKSWREGSVTWNNAPAVSGSRVAALTGRVRPGTAYHVDVSPLIDGNGSVTIRIRNPSTDAVRYFSKEAGAAVAPTLHVRCHQGLSSRVLTPDGSDTFDVGLSGGVLSMSAPSSNTGGNLREVFWPSDEPSAPEAQSCATWLDQTADRVQEGVALLVVAGPSSTRAITVTKNIWAGYYWVFNVHTWDSSLAEPFTSIGQFDMSSVLVVNGALQPLPWRLCARVVGSTLTFKVWLPDREAEPGWNDPTHAASTTVPSDYLTPGKAGWYVGHIPPGASAHYGDLGIWQPPPA